MINALSFDFEEETDAYFFRNTGVKLDLVETINFIIKELKKNKYNCTFFLLYSTAIKYPEIVDSIILNGHEIGFHGNKHLFLEEIDKKQFQNDINKFLSFIKSINNNTNVYGYRAPNFSLNQNTSWAIDILTDCGFKYDSSIVSGKNYLNGINGAPNKPYFIDSNNLIKPASQGLVEFPVNTMNLKIVKIPYAGGFYFRLLPIGIIKHFVKNNNSNNIPINFYFHPWEIDLNANKLKNWTMSINSGKTLRNKLQLFLSHYKFDSIYNILKDLSFI